MTTTNYEIAKEKCKFYHRTMNPDSGIVSAEASGSRSNLESELRSKRHDNKKASSSYKQTRLTHRTDNVEVVERVIVPESNEKNDDDSNNEDADHLESERIMVPSGEYLIGAEIMTSCILNSYHGRASEKHVSMISDSSFRSVRMEFQPHSFVDLMVRPDILYKTDHYDTSVDRKGIAEIVPARLAEYRRRDGRSHSGATLGLSSSTSDRHTYSRFIARG